MTTRLSEHFSLEEFILSPTALALGIKNAPTTAHLTHLKALAEQMEKVRALFGKPIIVTSAYRNPELNAAVNGVPTSAHALGHAADFHVHGLIDLEAAMRVRDSNLKFDQLIYEKNRCVHISFDPRLAASPPGMRRDVRRQPGGPQTRTYPGLEP